VAGSEEQGNKFEDLFEDLDKFFAPIEQVDRPLQDATGQEEPASPASAKDRATADEASPAPVPPAGTPPRPAEPADPAPSGEPTGEMSGADWLRLRDALGEQKQDEESRFLVESPSEPSQEPLVVEASDESGRGGPDREVPADEGREITIEDMKKVPPQYVDLPASGETVAATPPAAPEPDEPRGLGPEPGMADVEAAADRLAEDFGAVPEPEPEGGSAPPDETPAVDEELLPPLDQPLRARRPRTVKVGEPESLMGPTWEEPTGSRALMSEPPFPGGLGRNLPAAVITGAALVVVAAISLAIAKAAFAIVAGGIVLIGQAELYAAMHRKGYQPATALGLVVGGLVLAAAYLKGETAMLFFLALGLILSFLWYMAGTPRGRENAVQNVGSTLLGIVYVPFLAGYALILLSQPTSGRALMLVVIGLSVAYDTAAFFFGTFWGKRPLAPTISPKKSQEGLLGATIITFLLSIGLVPTVIKYLSLADAVGLALIVSVFAPLGDLAESALKRDLGVKDMGAVLPGHGGVLDRIDSILFVAPAALYFLRLIL
jgi:phosphatidate cytidylyltransferase